MGEEILGVIGIAKGRKRLNLYLTPVRSIFTRLSGGALSLVSAIGGGILTDIAAQAVEARKAKNAAAGQSQESPEELLASHKKNFSIPHADVSEAELKRPRRGFHYGKLIIRTNGGKTRKFLRTSKKGYEEDAQLLHSVLGAKVVET